MRSVWTGPRLRPRTPLGFLDPELVARVLHSGGLVLDSEVVVRLARVVPGLQAPLRAAVSMDPTSYRDPQNIVVTAHRSMAGDQVVAPGVLSHASTLPTPLLLRGTSSSAWRVADEPSSRLTGTLGFVVRGRGNVVVVLGLIPLGGAALVWWGPDALGLGDTSSEGPAWRRLVYLLLALTALCAAASAHRRGAARWAPLWGIAGGAMAVVFFVVIALALMSIGSGSDSGGCPDGRVYC